MGRLVVLRGIAVDDPARVGGRGPLGLVGCGGRGTGAASNALSVPEGNLKLVAMADVFDNKLSASYQQLSQSFQDKMDVPPERRFVSFDGYLWTGRFANG